MYPHQKKKKGKEKEASLVRMTRVHAATVAVEMASNGVAAMVQILGLQLYWETTRGVKKSWWLWSEWEWVKAYSCVVYSLCVCVAALLPSFVHWVKTSLTVAANHVKSCAQLHIGQPNSVLENRKVSFLSCQEDSRIDVCTSVLPLLQFLWSSNNRFTGTLPL